MIVGDTHGNIEWLRKYIFPVAMTVKANVIVVVGDYGAWEHTEAGRLFMNRVDLLAAKARTPLYWLHGNHDKWSHTMKTYGHLRDADGFVRVRENVFYIPQGHCWTWGGTSLRSFGGAYSVDKSWRVQAEKDAHYKIVRQARSLASTSVLGTDDIPDQRGTLWFPEEEMTDADMEQLLLDDFATKDIVLSHDKPMSAKPGWNRKDFAVCVPNQLRLDRALRVHKPKLWIHGHLHYHYVDELNGQDFRTTVVGLEPDNDAAESAAWRRENTWLLLELPPVLMRLGRDVTLPPATLSKAKQKLTRLF
jgi:Icc-related predicted phosphoesterase